MTEDDTELLRYPIAWRWRVRLGIAGSALVFGFAVHGATFEWPSDPVQVRWLAGILVGSGAALIALLRYHQLLSHQVRVSPAGLAHVRRGRTVRELQWREIDRVRMRRVLGRLEFRSGLGRGTVAVDEHVEGFEWLRSLVERRTGRAVEQRWI